MDSNTATCISPLPPVTQAVWRRLLRHALATWRAWRAQVRWSREIRALEALSDATLRDIGLAERVPYSPACPLRDYERGRW